MRSCTRPAWMGCWVVNLSSAHASATDRRAQPHCVCGSDAHPSHIYGYTRYGKADKCLSMCGIPRWCAIEWLNSVSEPHRPTVAQLRNLKVGDFAIVTPPPSKSDPFDMGYWVATQSASRVCTRWAAALFARPPPPHFAAWDVSAVSCVLITIPTEIMLR